MVIARQPFCWKWISVTKVSKYGKSEYLRALNASYTFQPLWVSVNMQECLIFKKGWEPVTQGTGELLKLLSPHFSKGGPEWVFNRLVCLAHLFLMLLFVLNFAIFAISMGENDKRSLNFAKEFSTSFYFQKNEVWTTTFLNKLEQVKIRYILS